MFYLQSCLHVHAGGHFYIKSWSPEIDTDILEEPENQRVFADDKVSKVMIFVQSCLYMAMQGCILMLRAEAQKSIETFLRRQK